MEEDEWFYEVSGKRKDIKKWHFVLYIIYKFGPISTSEISYSLQSKFPSMKTSRVWQILKICQMNGWVHSEKRIRGRGRPKLVWTLTERCEKYWRKTNLFEKIYKILHPNYMK
jgi:DNA-binding PadR family transcriptional regulator